jgi:DNA-binding response OmpR family regulator
MSKRIVIIDDDKVFSGILQLGLKRKGFDCYLLGNVEDALNLLPHSEDVDLFIVDYHLGHIQTNGLDLCRKIKAYTGRPVIMLTGEKSVNTTVACLHAGAEQYIVKPYVLEELVARIQVVLKNQRPKEKEFATTGEQTLSSKDIKLNGKSRILSSDDVAISLTERETAIAEVLMSNQGEEIKRDYIYTALYGVQMPPFARTVDILIGRFRRKLAMVTEKYVILPTRNSGYILARK